MCDTATDVRCESCSNPIDIEDRKDNPLCDQCSQETYVRNAFFGICHHIKLLNLPFKVSISVKFEVEESRINGVIKEGYVVSIINTDALINAIGLGRTVKEAGEKAVTELKQQIEKARQMYGGAAA